jgi:hypothetical protein
MRKKPYLEVWETNVVDDVPGPNEEGSPVLVE